MSFISLTSDLGLKDGSVARIKSKLLSQNSTVNMIDVSHQINPFDLKEAAYVLRNCIQSFPKYSVHLIFVDTFDHPIQKAICTQIGDQFFLCNDNGLVSLLVDESDSYKTVKLEDSEAHNREDTLCWAAIKLSRDSRAFTELGIPFLPQSHIALRPISKQHQITGIIIYIDTYGNAISNISRTLFESQKAGRNFEIYARNHRFTQIRNRYFDIVPKDGVESQFIGEKMALFNDMDLLEIALYKSNSDLVGGASQLLGLGKGEKIIINFIG